MNHQKTSAFRRVTARFTSIINSFARPIFSTWLICFAAFVFGSVFQTKAQTAGTLDTTFGTGGKVVSPINANNNTEQINDLALQPDGKIIAGGFVNGNTSTPPTTQDFGVKRYNPDGTLDTSFGSAGSVALNFDLYLSNPPNPASTIGTLDNITAIALQPDGKILAVGFTYKTAAAAYDGVSYAIARFNADGSLDTTFGTNGKLKTNFGNAYNIDVTLAPPSLVLQPDGKFYVASARQSIASNYVEVVLSRFNADGSGDTNYGNGGTASTRLFANQPGASAYAYRIAQQPDGKIVLGGNFRYDPASGGRHAGGIFARYNTDGSLDNNFADGGVLIYESAVNRQLDYVTDVRIEPDGKIIAAGGGYLGGGKSILVRLNASGTFDTSFGTNGFVTTSHLPATTALIRRQADGKYILGSSDDSNNVDFIAARYNNNGSVDTSFGPNGQGFITTNFNGGQDEVYAMLLQPDGKIVLGGSAFFQGGQHFALARYNAGSIVTRRTPFDFDGDSKTDIGIFRPSNGQWWINRSSTGQTNALQFGNASDKPLPTDFTGDGKSDIALFRPSSGEWFILRSEDNSFYSFPFGASGDIPLVGDFDGDGKSDPTIFRPSTREWFVSKSSGGTLIVTFGVSGDQPVLADYDGDGKTDFAIYRPSVGQWWISRSSNGSVYAFQFGTSTDKPVQGDYTGDGKADSAFFRPSTGEWFILRSEDSSFYSVPFGTSGDLPAPGDYDGDGKTDTAVFRPSQNTWYVNRSTAGLLIAQFGIAGDKPLPNVFVP